MDGDPKDDPRLIAAVDMIGRTGATQFQLRWSDDEQPIVWFAVGAWTENGRTLHETAASLNPVQAVLRLCEQVMDGAMCTHCNRPSGIDTDLVPEPMPLPVSICWYQFDPELATFRRSCENAA